MVATKGVGDTTWVRKAACDCYYSELNGSGYDYDSRIHGCPVEEHSLGRKITLVKKKKNDGPISEAQNSCGDGSWGTAS